MSSTYIKLLQKRIDGLAEKDFNLEVWKSSSALLLTRIFGENNPYSKEIESLKVDFSSWSLRDATSDYNPRETCKRLGRESLEMAIEELKIESKKEDFNAVKLEMLKSHSEDLATAVKQKDKQTVLEILKKTSKAELSNLLVKILLD